MARSGKVAANSSSQVGRHTSPEGRQPPPATGHLEDLAARQPEPDRVETTTAVGEAADTIVEEIGVRRPDLVVMSTHGRSGIRRWIYGSVADEVMRRAPVPVLLVPAACPGEWPSNRAPRVLLPLDGSELAEGALGLVDT